MKYPYTKNILTERLAKEEKDLLMWQKIVADNKDELSVRQANGNIPNNEYRIDEQKMIYCFHLMDRINL